MCVGAGFRYFVVQFDWVTSLVGRKYAFAETRLLCFERLLTGKLTFAARPGHASCPWDAGSRRVAAADGSSLVLSVLGGPVSLVTAGIATVTAGIATLLGARSAAGSLALARRVDEMSLPYFAVCGAVVGIVLSIPSWNLTTTSYVLNAAIVGVLALMCAGCAAGLLSLIHISEPTRPY